MEINWYPGHMAKARRMLEEHVKLADVVAEVLDARIPRSSRNPEFENLFSRKRRVAILNKADLADPAVTRAWLLRFEAEGVTAQAVAASAGNSRGQIVACLERAIGPEARRLREDRGIRKTFRVLVAGIPNVGKSTLINRLSGRDAARTGGNPGVTRGRQIVRVTPYLELIDTPGLLWPKLDDPAVARHLAFTGAIRNEITDAYGLGLLLLEEIAGLYPGRLEARYGVAGDQASGPAAQLLRTICLKRGFLGAGAEPDEERGAAAVIREFRSGKLGPMSLERPEEEGGAASDG